MGVEHGARHEVFSAINFDKAGHSDTLLVSEEAPADSTDVASHLIRAPSQGVPQHVRKRVVNFGLAAVQLLYVFDRLGHVELTGKVARRIRRFWAKINACVI